VPATTDCAKVVWEIMRKHFAPRRRATTEIQKVLHVKTKPAVKETAVSV